MQQQPPALDSSTRHAQGRGREQTERAADVARGSHARVTRAPLPRLCAAPPVTATPPRRRLAHTSTAAQHTVHRQAAGLGWSMGMASSRSGSGGSNPRAVPALLERHAELLARFTGEEAVAVGDPFWCALPFSVASCRSRLTRLLRPAFLAFPDLLTRFRPEDVEHHLSPSCGALGAPRCRVCASASADAFARSVAQRAHVPLPEAAAAHRHAAA